MKVLEDEADLQYEIALRKRLLGQPLRDLRIKNDLTQNYVAETLGYTSAQFVSNWERGQSSPPVNVIGTLAKLYKVAPAELIRIFFRFQEECLKHQQKTLLKRVKGGKF